MFILSAPSSLFIDAAYTYGIANSGVARSSSTHPLNSDGASKAIDNILSNSNGTTDFFRSENAPNQWWSVELGEPYFILDFTVYKQSGALEYGELGIMQANIFSFFFNDPRVNITKK